MKSKDVYFISFGGLQVFIFFQLFEFAQQLLMVRTSAGKQAFVVVLGLLVVATFFLLYQNFVRLIQMLTVSEKEVYDRLVPLAQGTVAVLSLFMIVTLLQSFILFF